MTKTITIALPHTLTQAEARARIEKGLADLHSTHAARISHFEEKWTDNHLDFHLHAVGQHLSGRLDILPDEVRVAIDLPWMLAMLAGKFTKQVEEQGRRMLEKRG